MEEAGGAHIGINKTFDNVTVSGSTLEIHLYWAGKGTNALPERGVYGPLISAITVTPSTADSNIDHDLLCFSLRVTVTITNPLSSQTIRSIPGVVAYLLEQLLELLLHHVCLSC